MGLLKKQTQAETLNTLFERLYRKEAKMAVVGLGDVGLPLALQMASKFRVIGYDISKDKVGLIQQEKDPNMRVSPLDFKDKDFFATDIENLLGVVQFYIVTVPTISINNNEKPNLIPLKKATATIARHLKEGDVVVFESTVYPGCVEEICVPILEKISGLTSGEDFNVEYSLECIHQEEKFVLESNRESQNEITNIHELVNKEIYKAIQKPKESFSPLKKVLSTNKEIVDVIVSKISKVIESKKSSHKGGTILIKGITFKANVSKIENSKAAELYIALQRKGYKVVVQDNHVYPSEVKAHYGIELTTSTNQHFDVIVLAVDHDNYKKLTYADYFKNARTDTVFFDIKGDKKEMFPPDVYLSL